jgi:Novel toxin 10
MDGTQERMAGNRAQGETQKLAELECPTLRQHRAKGWATRPTGSCFLAAAVLRFQCLSPAQARGEVALHASQPGEAETGIVARAMALEQLPSLFVKRKGAGEDWELIVDEGIRMRRRDYRIPPFAKTRTAKDGAPLVSLRRQRAGHPSPSGFQVIEFPTPEGIASPINRTNPGFVGGGKTAGGLPEYTVPNGPIPKNATTRTVPPE